MTNNSIKIIFSILSITFLSCSTNREDKKGNSQNLLQEKQISVVENIVSPTQNESSVSNLFVDEEGQIYLTWIEPKPEKVNTLFLSKLEEDVWQKPIRIAEGENWVVNWADSPSLTKFGDNSLVANFLKTTNEENFAYDVHLSISNTDGKTWNKPIKPHLDNTKTEHGFVSLVPYGRNSFMAIWLDGRKYAESEDAEMTLRAAIINQNGEIQESFLVDDKVCDCCGTNAITTDSGIVVVYRNRSDNEIRDFYTSSFNNGIWSEPKIVAKDNWEIKGCPVNGAAIDALDSQLTIAWFSAANDKPKVNIVFSKNYGETFSMPIKINTTQTQGRVDVCFINEEKTAVSWMEDGVIKVRLVNNDGSGKMEKPFIVSAIEGSRASGFPKMVKSGDELLFTWTEAGNENHIKTAKIKISTIE